MQDCANGTLSLLMAVIRLVLVPDRPGATCFRKSLNPFIYPMYLTPMSFVKYHDRKVISSG